MLPNVGWPELIVILTIALLIFGPQRLAGVGAAVGQALREFRKAVREADGNAEPHARDAGDQRPPSSSSSGH